MGESPFRPAESIGPNVIERIARVATHRAARVRAVTPLSGRSINPVLAVEIAGGPSIVVKIRRGAGRGLFEAEAYQLQYLAEKRILSVPRVLAHGSDRANGPYTYLVLERLPGIQWAVAQATLATPHRWLLQEELGALIGTLHREVTGNAFGEVLPTRSRPCGDWADFFASCDETASRSCSTAIDWIRRRSTRSPGFTATSHGYSTRATFLDSSTAISVPPRFFARSVRGKAGAGV